MPGVEYGPIKPTKMAPPKMATPTRMTGGIPKPSMGDRLKGTVAKPGTFKEAKPAAVTAAGKKPRVPTAGSRLRGALGSRSRAGGPGSRGPKIKPPSPKGTGTGFDGLSDLEQ